MGLFGKSKLDLEEMDPYIGAEHEDMPQLPKPVSNTVIAKGVTITGALRGEGVIQVEGVVEGEIELRGAVIVADSGLVKGPILADVVHVSGRVEGSVNAREHFRLERSGSLEGDVATVSLIVEDGGRLNGRSTMAVPQKAVPLPKAPADEVPQEAEAPAEA